MASKDEPRTPRHVILRGSQELAAGRPQNLRRGRERVATGTPEDASDPLALTMVRARFAVRLFGRSKARARPAAERKAAGTQPPVPPAPTPTPGLPQTLSLRPP